MKKRILAVLLAAVTLLSSAAFTSCSEESDYPVNVGGIKIEEEPDKIVVLSKNLADIISNIGYDVKLVGRSDEVNQKGMAVVPSVGEENIASAVSIVNLGAEVVFSDDTINTDTKNALIKHGTPVVIPEEANTPKQLKNVYRQLGTILGGNIKGKKKADEAFKDLYDELTDVKNAIAETNLVRTVCYLYIENGALKTMHSASWGSKMLGFTGADNVFKNEKTPVVDVDKLLLSNPDFIFCSDMKTVKYLRTKKTFKRLTAIRKNIHIIPLDNINSQGATASAVVEKMLRYMFPEEFE